MLPKRFRYALFERLSVQTMRFVNAVANAEASGLLARIYEQIEQDFFINGSLTSHSQVPELLAGVWIAGREAILQPDQLDQMTKEAMAAALSQVNDCPYCGDMLISLVHSAGEPKAATQIFSGRDQAINNRQLSERIQWVSQAARPGAQLPAAMPFSVAQYPEAIATLVAMGHINRYSHIVMNGSPVPFGQSSLKRAALSMFALELKDVIAQNLKPGRSLSLLPEAELPADMRWAQPNPRIADAMSRWAAVVDRHIHTVLDAELIRSIQQRLQEWNGGLMPVSRSWVEAELSAVPDSQKAAVRLILIVAMAPYQFSEDLITPVLGAGQREDQIRLIKILNFAALLGARHLGRRLGAHYSPHLFFESRQVA